MAFACVLWWHWWCHSTQAQEAKANGCLPPCLMGPFSAWSAASLEFIRGYSTGPQVTPLFVGFLGILTRKKLAKASRFFVGDWRLGLAD